MRKNGFTLIELLAVIVILAIIALIATPIILGIINDAREKANERSVELYASAVKNGIAAYQLLEGKGVAAGTYGENNPLPFEIEYDGEVECTTIELYENGGVYVEGCTVNGTEVDYTYGTKQVAKGTMSICNPLDIQEEGKYTAGDKYECDVDPNKDGYDQIFYVLNASSTEVNLIMDSNIRTGGEAVKEANPTGEQKGLVAWITQTNYESAGGTAWYEDDMDNSYGPITAMNYLQTATSGWTNTNELTINSFTDNNGDTHPMIEYVVNARMPYYSEILNVSTQTMYLIDYLCGDDDLFEGITGRNGVSGVIGYWTLSFESSGIGSPYHVNRFGYVDYVNYDDYFGVRPVINLSI